MCCSARWLFAKRCLRHFLNPMTSKNQREREGNSRVQQYGKYIYMVVLVTIVFFFAWRTLVGPRIGGWKEYTAIPLALLGEAVFAYLYVSSFKDSVKANGHYENLLALSVAANFFASFSPKGWAFLLFIPPYLAYLAWEFLAAAKGAFMPGAAAASSSRQPVSAAKSK